MRANSHFKGGKSSLCIRGNVLGPLRGIKVRGTLPECFRKGREIYHSRGGWKKADQYRNEKERGSLAGGREIKEGFGYRV